MLPNDGIGLFDRAADGGRSLVLTANRGTIPALEAYDRARYVTRLGEGVQSVRQTAILHREANALAAIGDYATANDRHEFAYDLSLRAYGRNDPRHMVATQLKTFTPVGTAISIVAYMK